MVISQENCPLTTTETISTRMIPPDDGIERVYGLTRATWVKIGVITALMALVFWPNLRRLWLKTNPISGDPNWGHSVIVPIVGLYYLYVNREELLRAPVMPLAVTASFAKRWIPSAVTLATGLLIYFVAGAVPSLNPLGVVQALGMGVTVLGILTLLLNWGLGTLLCGILIAGYGIYPGRNDFVWDFGMVVTLFGVVLYMTGWRVMRVAWFPIAFLVCALPWPGLVYSKVALPLQNLAAYVAVHVLNLTGVMSSQGGTKIFIGNPDNGPVRALNVAEACAGMRSLMTFISVGAAVSFLSNRPLWQKLIITASAVPIAIFCNVMRVSGQGILDTYVSQKLSEGFAHAFAGMVMLVPGFFLILVVGWLLDKIFIEEADEESVNALGNGGNELKSSAASAPLVVEIPRRRSQVQQGGAQEKAAMPDEARPMTIPIPQVRRGSDDIDKGGM